MHACVDVDYREDGAVAGCVLFREWTDDRADSELVARSRLAAPYEPGRFYLRELPPLLAVLALVRVPLATVVIDGYVWLGNAPGLGARLHDALEGRVPVIGVAKKPWAVGEDTTAVAVMRGRSAKPLYVTAAGIDAGAAARLVAGMHGAYRLPALLKAVDRLVRSSP
jgi:deoxyribonuclease V